MINKGQLVSVRHHLNEFLKGEEGKKLQDELGIFIYLGKGTYGVKGGTITMEIKPPVGTNPYAELEEAFKANAKFYGLKESDLGKSFRDWEGKLFRIIGAKPQNKKYPILGKSTRGTIYKFATSDIVGNII